MRKKGEDSTLLLFNIIRFRDEVSTKTDRDLVKIYDGLALINNNY